MKNEIKIPFFLVWRHLRYGNKWTLGLIIFLLAIAFINLIFISSLFAGIIKNTNNQIIDTYTSHLVIFPQTNQDFLAVDEPLLNKLKAVNGVTGTSAQILVPASLKYKNFKGNWQILAIDPEQEKTVTNVAQKMTAGEYLQADDTEGIIIGRQIAGGENVELNAFSFKDAEVGDKVTLAFDNLTKDLIIRGIFYTKFLDADQRAFITQKTLNGMTPLWQNKATSILIRLNKTGQENQVMDRIKNLGLEGNFYTWEEVAGLMKSVAKSFLSINVILSFVGIMIAAITIFIVIYIDVSSKRQQIGILRAIGIKPYLIVFNYILQTVIYSLTGVVVGTALFFGAIVPYFLAHPFALPIGDVQLSLGIADFIIRLESFIWVSMLAGTIPAILVTRIKILDAIWGEK